MTHKGGRKSSLTEAEEKKVVQLWGAGLDVTSLATRMSVSKSVIDRTLRKFGVERKGSCRFEFGV